MSNNLLFTTPPTDVLVPSTNLTGIWYNVRTGMACNSEGKLFMLRVKPNKKGVRKFKCK